MCNPSTQDGETKRLGVRGQLGAITEALFKQCVCGGVNGTASHSCGERGDAQVLHSRLLFLF